LLLFTSRIKRTPLLASKLAQRLVKRRLTSILIVISFLMEIFRRLNAVSTAFHTPNPTHATFSFETSPADRKTPPYVDNERIFFPVGDISKFERCFCCISHEECNALHFYLRNKTAARKTPPYVDFDRNFYPDGDILTFKRCFCCF
jgi:hypothetical protein